VTERLGPPLAAPIFERIAIVGVGLIGSSIARAARRKNAAGSIAVADASPQARGRAAALGLGFLVHVWRVARDRQDATGRSLSGDAPAKAAFRFSILYLFVLFASLAVDHFVG